MRPDETGRTMIAVWRTRRRNFLARYSDQFGWFLAGQASWFIAFGIQAVLFPYLVVNVLDASPERVGLAQMCLMAPALVLMLPGGMLADSRDLRGLLVIVQALAMVPVLALAATITAGGATFAALIGYALAHGCLQAMVVPARDALLGRVAGNDVQRAITTAMAVQFVCQIFGFLMAGMAGTVGAPALLGAQAVFYCLGAFAASRLRPAPPVGKPPLPPSIGRPLINPPNGPSCLRLPAGGSGGLRELLAALRETTDSPRMGPIMLIMVGVGFFFIAAFNVVIPVMVRDLYLGGSAALAMINGCFVVGLITATLALMRRAPVIEQGRAIMICAFGGALLVALFSLHPPMVMFYLLIYLFGIGAGVLMTLGRTVVQESVRPEFRARVLAFYSLGFLGSAPLGSVAIGQIAQWTSVLFAAAFAGLGMALLLTAVALWTPIWSVVRLAPAVGGPPDATQSGSVP